LSCNGEREIDAKLDDQQAAVNWWRASVQRKGGAGGVHSDVAESATSLTVAQAERILKYDQQTISKWNLKLARRYFESRRPPHSARPRLSRNAAR